MQLPIVELREYRIKSGKKAQWTKWFMDELLPYQESKGMKVTSVNTYQDIQGNDWFVWMREFDDEASLKRTYEQTYNAWWIGHIRPRVFALIEQESIKVRRLNKLM